MDVILALNVPFVLQPGSFDGFPTNCCLEAGSYGVVLICTDPLNLNKVFTSGKDIYIVEPVVKNVTDIVLNLTQNLSLLYDIGTSGQAIIKKYFGLQNQIVPRIKLLQDLLQIKRL